MNINSDGKRDFIQFKFNEDNNIAYVIAMADDIEKLEGTKVSGLGVYIPELMTEIDMKTGPYVAKKVLSSSMVKNSNFSFKFSNNILVANYLLVNSPKYIVPDEAEKIGLTTRLNVKFENGNINKAYYTGIAKIN